MQQALQPTQDRDWLLVEQGYDPRARERASNRASPSATASSVFAGRGRSAAALPGCPGCTHFRWASWPRTYVAGTVRHAQYRAACPGPGAGGRLAPLADTAQRQGAAAARRRYAWPPADPGHAAGLDAHGVAAARSRAGSSSRRQRSALCRWPIAIWAFSLFAWRWSRATPRSRWTRGSTRWAAGLDPVRLEQDLGVWRTEQSGKSLAMACTAALQLNGAELSPRALGPVQMVLELGVGARSGSILPAHDRCGAERRSVRGSRSGSTRRARSSEADRMAWRARRT